MSIWWKANGKWKSAATGAFHTLQFSSKTATAHNLLAIEHEDCEILLHNQPWHSKPSGLHKLILGSIS